MNKIEWVKIGYQPVGGLREIGFINNSDYLMVLGGSGRTIFNCQTTEKYARDRNDYYSERWNYKTGIVEGFEKFDGEKIICGGFEFPDQLRKKTNDNWTTIINKEKRLDYKKEVNDAEVLYLLNTETDSKIEINVFLYGITRSYGFSPSNRYFIISDTDGITIWEKVNQNLNEQIDDAIKYLKSIEGENIIVEDKLASIGISYEPYQTTYGYFTLNSFKHEKINERQIIKLMGQNQQIEFRLRDIKKVILANNDLQIDINIKNSIWRKIIVRKTTPDTIDYHVH